jgi:triosephosphate isomerase
MSRKKIVAGNWKMNKTFTEGLELISEAMPMIKDELHKKVTVLFFPPFIHLASIHKLIQHEQGFSVGAQNVHQKTSGAYTGEVSADMLRSVGATHVLIGHSERRQYFNETAELLKEKVDTALAAGLHIVFCFGELLQEREASKHFEVVKQQLHDSLFHLTADQFDKIILAYEPVWAIGTGLTASPEQAQEMHAYIRSLLQTQYGQAIADATSILYGGSCNAANAAQLFSQADIDGGLIGGASLKSRDFCTIVTAFNNL